MLRIRLTAVAATFGIVALAALWPATGQAPAATARLPGARPVIDAIHYPSLQAAIDALPAEGGLVRLPPGTFEIDRPGLGAIRWPGARIRRTV